MIPFFDPNKDIITIDQQIKKVDDLAKKYDWDDCSIYKLIIPRLQGHSKHWFTWEQHHLLTWAETKTALLQQFKRKTSFSKLLREAISYETEPGQDLGEYCSTKLQKIRKCQLGVTDEAIIDLIIDGVKNARIAGDIRAAGKTTINDFFNHMCSLGETPPFVKTLRKKEKINGTSRGPLQKYKSYVHHEEQGKRIQENVFCYNCGQTGYKSWRCINYNKMHEVKPYRAYKGHLYNSKN